MCCCIDWLKRPGDSGAIGTEKFGIGNSSEDRWFDWGLLGSEICTDWNDGMRDSICENGDDGRSVGRILVTIAGISCCVVVR